MFASPWTKALCALAALTATAVSSLTIDERATEIVDKFSDDDIIGQMTQVNIDAILAADGTLDEDKVRGFAKQKVGSYLNSPYAGGPRNGKYGWNATEWRDIITRIQNITMTENGGHPMIYGVDSVHGANYVSNATIFGQQINAGATFNPDLVFKMGQITGRDTVAAGMPWIFGPILEIAQNPLWARTYETFGEDPYLVSVMGAQIIRGIQNNTNVAACMKHFMGYSKTPTGHDRDGVSLSDFDLLNYFAPPFIAAVKAGVLSAMENYISINGVPTVASTKILRDLLRYDLGFEGFVVTDWAEINNLNLYHRVARTKEDAVRLALTRTSLDMSMVPDDASFIGYTNSLLKTHPELRSRLKESARRIVKTKLQIGLYENPVPGVNEVAKVGQEADTAVALELARESIVLLQNKDKVLPLAEGAQVFLTGHSAHNIGNLCGGWTLAWQGSTGNDQYPNGISIKMGMEKVGVSGVTYFNGLKADGTYTAEDLAWAKSAAAASPYTVVAIGEPPYTEKPGDINDLALPAGQIQYVKELAATKTKVIVVLVGGRPRLLGDLPSNVHAVINAMLPGQVGGRAIADIIYGKVNPSGRLPLTYHKYPGTVAIPYNHQVTSSCVDATNPCEVQWEFGSGLSYSEFSYESFKLSKTTVTSASDSLTVSVTVRNRGTMAGKETVMLFLTQPYREMTVPEVKQLKKFQKVEVLAGRTQTVTFTLTSEDWSVFDPQIGNGFVRVAENGEFVVALKPETKCDVYHADLGNPLCARFTLDAAAAPVSLSVADVAGTVVAFGGRKL